MTKEKAEILFVQNKRFNFAPYSVNWVSNSTKFIACGQKRTGTGVFAICNIQEGKINVIQEYEKKNPFKCSIQVATCFHPGTVATGDFGGKLAVWDLERPELPIYSVQAHTKIINAIDRAGNSTDSGIQPELATCGPDGFISIWDLRQKGVPVARIGSKENSPSSDTWTVAFGGNHSDRIICGGYANGDVKLFDLKTMSMRWSRNISNGVCSIDFDQKSSTPSKLICSTVNSTIHSFDYPQLDEILPTILTPHDDTTIWSIRHIPQNSQYFISCASNGSLSLFSHSRDNANVTPSILDSSSASESAIISIDFSPDKMGLFLTTGFDCNVRLGLIKNLSTIQSIFHLGNDVSIS